MGGRAHLDDINRGYHTNLAPAARVAQDLPAQFGHDRLSSRHSLAAQDQQAHHQLDRLVADHRSRGQIHVARACAAEAHRQDQRRILQHQRHQRAPFCRRPARRRCRGPCWHGQRQRRFHRHRAIARCLHLSPRPAIFARGRVAARRRPCSLPNHPNLPFPVLGRGFARSGSSDRRERGAAEPHGCSAGHPAAAAGCDRQPQFAASTRGGSDDSHLAETARARGRQ